MKKVSPSLRSGPSAGEKKEINPMQVSRKKFLRRWIPFGVAMLREAEGLGLDVSKIPLERLAAEITFAQEWLKGQQEVRRVG